MRFPFSVELLHRLPQHPDWRYELIDGEALLSPRPRHLQLRRPTALPVPQTRLDAEVRELDASSDRAAVAALLLETWSEADPYRSLESPAELLRSEIERGLDTAAFGAVARDTDGVCAVALVYDDGASGAPRLSWLTVAYHARDRGLATAMLRLITAKLRARGISELRSAASAANTPSLRWHLARGFQLAEDPVREALCPHRSPSTRAQF